jgi:protein-S-isoprenylcysteine O-methyltransferase Ste14
MPVALLVESALVVTGLTLFVAGARWSRQRSWALVILVLVVLLLTIVGMTVAPPPPSARAMAGSSIATIAVLCAFVLWLGRPAARPFIVPTA